LLFDPPKPPNKAAAIFSFSVNTLGAGGAAGAAAGAGEEALDVVD
jgi:hypothetical protein